LKRGYLGIAGQPVTLPAAQGGTEERSQALLVVGVTAGSPAAQAGIIVGDVLLAFDGQPVESPEDLLDLLTGDRVGRAVALRLLRGGTATDATVTVGERPGR
jgi:S1-C subfamily serine protease